MLSGPPRWNANRIAAAIAPDTEADAPIIGNCEPALVARVIAEMALARGADEQDLGAQVTRNFDALFGPSISHQTA